MAMRYCFTLNNRQICIEVPVLYDRFWWLKPQPDPWKWVDFLKPDPTPWKQLGWIQDELLKPEALAELSTLAEIERLTKQLSGPNRELFSVTLREALAKVETPKDVQVRFD